VLRAPCGSSEPDRGFCALILSLKARPDIRSGGVSGPQDGAVLGARDAIQRANHFVGTEHERGRRGFFGAGIRSNDQGFLRVTVRISSGPSPLASDQSAAQPGDVLDVSAPYMRDRLRTCMSSSMRWRCGVWEAPMRCRLVHPGACGGWYRGSQINSTNPSKEARLERRSMHSPEAG
jgi:hypothetical protein